MDKEPLVTAAAMDGGDRAAAITSQLEFYFSDANLRRDRFLRQHIDSSDGGWITLATLLTFNKLKRLGATHSDLTAAASASSELEISPNGTMVRRVVPLPPADPAQGDTATIYVEGFGEDVDIDKLTRFFSTYGTVVYVSLPRLTVTKKPKGFAFVEFDTDEAAAALVAAAKDGRLTIEADDWRGVLSLSKSSNELRVMAVPLWKALRSKYSTLVKSHRARDRADADAADKGLAAVVARMRRGGRGSDDNGAACAIEGDGAGHASHPPVKIPRGVLVHVFGVPAKATKAWIRKQVEDVAPIEYVDFKKGSARGVLRFATRGGRDAAIAAFSQPAASSDGAHLSAFYLTPLTDTDEAEYMSKLVGTVAQGATTQPTMDAPRADAKHTRDSGDETERGEGAATAMAHDAETEPDAARRKRPKKKDRMHILFET